MNFDDKYTKDSEETFQKYLKEVRSFTPENYKIIEENLIIITEYVERIRNIPDKSPEDLEQIISLEVQLKGFVQKIDDMKLILSVSLYRQSLAYYEHVKKLAKEGNKEAEKIYNDLRIHVEKFDPN